MVNSIFITGTDTGVGKTHTSVALLKRFNQLNYSTFAIKPIASGCEYDINSRLVNEDALALMNACSIQCSYDAVNPIALPEAIAPHLAAQHVGMTLSVSKLCQLILKTINSSVDVNVIEGAGGWFVPLNDYELYSDVIQSLQIPVILTVAIRLGCLNHAILTHNAIKLSKVPFIGWIANCIEPNMLAARQNIDTLKNWLSVPCLAELPYQASDSDMKINIDIGYIQQYLMQCHNRVFHHE